ncbi:TPA: HAD-IB family phosphatase [Candidatus Woesearchaeota archaeon]|nr:HAD-IB family phosphatase [Candidatus Woesearchaeota archaeon]
MKNNLKYKLICFDLDGTIIDETIFIWQTLHDALGSDKVRRKKYAQDFVDKKITYRQWAEHDLELWREVGATRSKMLDATKGLILMPGALETLNELKRLKEKAKKEGNFFKLAIISGSLNIALEKVLPNYKDYFDDVYINHLIFDGKDGENLVGIKTTAFDFENKADALKEIVARENIPLGECVFIGDHDNDIHVAEIAGLSIAFNCKSERLAQIADIVIEKKDLREILKYIL